MSGSNSAARCLLRQSRAASSSLPVPASSRRCIHQSTSLKQRKPTVRRQQQQQQQQQKRALPPRESNMRNAQWAMEQARKKSDDIPLTREAAEEHFPAYTEEEKEFLRRKYSPEQMASIEAGEAAIDPLDLLKQGVARNDAMRVRYLDDFRNIDPVLDKKRIAPSSNYDPKLRFKTDDEIDEDLASFFQERALRGDKDGDDVALEFEKWMAKYRYTVGEEAAERDPPDYLAPELGKLTDPLVKRTAHSEDEAEDGDAAGGGGIYERLSAQTGLSEEYLQKLIRKDLVVNFVSNQTRMGKIRSLLITCAVGNGNGLLGIGNGKSTEMASAANQAFANAVRNMAPVPRYEGRTIYGDVKAKVGATVVELSNRPPGFGVRCQSKIFEMARCAGITDLAARVPRGRNPMNTVKAAHEALMSQRLPDDVARGRGKKMVDVRKVYFAGLV